ncbi:MAG: response regulator, partial [Chloroflexota bacterium]|nr:response regulator [Chloroflexota bacterium]
MFRLLIADDEDLVRRGLAALIQREAPEFTVVGAAADGLEALRLAEETSPDIVCTDIRMPGLSGLDLIERLRVARPGLRSIILSGYDDFAYARRAIGLGVAEYLLKPVDADQLLEILARLRAGIAAERQDERLRLEAARITAEQTVRRLLDGGAVDAAALSA